MSIRALNGHCHIRRKKDQQGLARSEAAYRRGDLFEKRRQLMADWATYCGSGGAADNGMPIPSREREAALQDARRHEPGRAEG